MYPKRKKKKKKKTKKCVFFSFSNDLLCFCFQKSRPLFCLFFFLLFFVCFFVLLSRVLSAIDSHVTAPLLNWSPYFAEGEKSFWSFSCKRPFFSIKKMDRGLTDPLFFEKMAWKGRSVRWAFTDEQKIPTFWVLG